MTYKGKEILESEITFDVINEIVETYCQTRGKFFNYNGEQKYMFGSQEILNDFLSYIHSNLRRKEINDIESAIINRIKERECLLYSDEYRNYLSERERKRKEYFARQRKLKRDKMLAKKEQENLPYKEQLTDKRWLAFRCFVFAIRGYQCEKCGAIENLQIHHPKYINGRNAWEYTCNEVVVLCESCHRKEHNIKI